MKIDTTGYPMMAEKEVEIIWKLFDKHLPKRCLEYGSGNSTIYFPVHHSIQYWLSIEHNGHYVNYLKDKISKKVDLQFIQDDELAYVNYPLMLDSFDFMLIDGQFRDKCVELAYKIANKDTIILLHDASRKESKPILDNWKGTVEILCEGELMQKDGFYAHRGLALLKK